MAFPALATQQLTERTTGPLSRVATRPLDTRPLPEYICPEDVDKLKAIQSELSNIRPDLMHKLTERLGQLRDQQVRETNLDRKKFLTAKVNGLEALLVLLPSVIDEENIFAGFKDAAIRAGLRIGHADIIKEARWSDLDIWVQNVLKSYSIIIWTIFSHYCQTISTEASDHVSYMIIQVWLARTIIEMIDNYEVIEVAPSEG